MPVDICSAVLAQAGAANRRRHELALAIRVAHHVDCELEHFGQGVGCFEVGTKSIGVLMATGAGKILTIEDLADYLKISKSTLYKLGQNGGLPGIKVGRHWRFHKDAVDAWLKSRPLHPTSEEGEPLKE